MAYTIVGPIKSTYFFSTLICKLFLRLLLTINDTVSIIIKSGIEETDEHLEEALKEGIFSSDIYDVTKKIPRYLITLETPR